MWCLRNIKNESIGYNFLVGEDYIVGRRCAQILLADDPSISRRHALLSVSHLPESLADISKPSVFHLRDEGSKYGTFKNDVRQEKDQEVVLSDGDLIRFGQFDNIFRVCFSALIVTTSCVPQALKTELKTAVYRLGGHVVPEWQTSCTHLVMSSVKVTVKALCCLVSLKAVVTPQFLTDLIDKCSKQSPLPQAKDYVPPIAEPLIDQSKASFSIVTDRSTLFKDKTFIFFDEKQLKKLHLALMLAGAEAILLTQKSEVDVNVLTRKNTCVIQPSGDVKLNVFVRTVQEELQKKKKRMIPESDFGLAVSYCTTEKFCNPDFDPGSHLFESKIFSQTFSASEVYVPDTNENGYGRMVQNKPLRTGSSSNSQTSASDSSLNCTVQESVETVNRKRNLSTESETSIREVKSKRIKTENLTPEETFDLGLDIEENESDSRKTCAKTEHPESAATNDDDHILNLDTLPTNDLSLSTTCPPAPIRSRALSTQMTFSTDVTPVTNLNGFQSNGKSSSGRTTASSETDDIDDGLPRNLMKISVVSLIKRQPLTSLQKSSHNRTHVINFKKFRKVRHAGSHGLPHIIGGRDLVPFADTITHRAIDDWVRENTIVHQSQPASSFDEHGEFDWNPSGSH